MKEILAITMLLLFTLAACTTTTQDNSVPEDQYMQGMPCHQMPDGSWMGECSEEDKNGEDMKMMHPPVTSEESFIVDMIPHHQEAVDTSKVLLQRTQNEELRVLLEAIIVAQEDEINMMNRWLEEWYSETENASTYQNMMPALDGPDVLAAEQAYLQGMIHHHEAAVVMAQEVIALNPRAEVEAFANQVIIVQSEEIDQMQQMLEAY